jgi:hypothetical protein
MRQLLIPTVVAGAMLAFAGAAYGVNVYEVTTAGARPSGKGSLNRPLPVGHPLRVHGHGRQPRQSRERGAPVQDRVRGARHVPRRVRVLHLLTGGARTGGEGMQKGEGRSRHGVQRRRSLGRPDGEGGLQPQALALQRHAPREAAGAAGMAEQGALAIRLDGDPPAPADADSRRAGCSLSIRTAIYAPFKSVRLGGLPASELRFRVPDNLAHPVTGLDNSVREAISGVGRKMRKARFRGKSRRLGFYNPVGCKRRRTTRVRFVDEQGRLFTARKNTRC